MIRDPSRVALREDAYRLLAACFYPPCPELFEERCLPALADLLEDLTPDAAQHARDAAHAGEQVSLGSLAVEHARLFIGPFQLVAPPYGSLYLDDAKIVMGESTGKVSAFYGSCGLHLADDFHEMPDHIAVELEFLSFLAHKERESVAAGDRGEANRFSGLQRSFLDRFLLPWLPPFTRSILEGTENPFYQAIARCTETYVTCDREFLERPSGASWDTANPRTS